MYHIERLLQAKQTDISARTQLETTDWRWGHRKSPGLAPLWVASLGNFLTLNFLNISIRATYAQNVSLNI